MAEANARFMKRKVKAGAIEVDIETCTLIVNYEVEATVLGDMGEPIVADRKSNQKLIRLKTLNENTDVPRLVDQILEQCKLIHESKRPLVEGLLRDLQRHQQHGAAPRAARRAAAEPHAEPQAPAERASLAQLPAYIDQCYEGVEAAVHATGLLLQLAREPPALEPLVQDERLLGCLVRLLVDEGKKSADLALNIVSVLYALSQYSDFHAQLLAAKVGSLVMDVVDLEIKRHELRRRERAAAAAAGSEAEEARERLRQRKSETLLYVCFHLLLNLSEDINTERKMAAHGLVPMLTAMLARQNADLLVLVLAFLKKLSIFGENASEMGRARLADKLVAFVPNQHDEVLEAVLRLLSNLAFQPKCRAQMAKAGLAPKLLSLLRKGRHRLLAVRLLYQLSHLDSERAKMTASVPMLVGTVINTPDVALVPAEVFGLVVNLMTHTDNARACAKARGALRGLVTLAVRAQHTLALKALRNMTQAAGEDHAEELARTYSADLLELAAGAHSADVQVEALGLLANLPLGSVDELAEQLAHSGALELIHELLVAGMVEDDATLEAVRFVGALAEHGGCAALLARSGRLLAQLLDCFDSHQDDDEIVLAVVHACYRLLFNEEAREWLLSESQLVSHLLELLFDKCMPIRTLCSSALDIVAEHDASGHWVRQIRETKFKTHNAEWLAAVEEDDVERYEEALAINQALGKMDLHDVDELDDDGADGAYAADGAHEEAGGDRYDDRYGDRYGVEYGLDAHSPGALAGAAGAYGALSEEAYMGVGGDEHSEFDEADADEYDEAHEVDEGYQ